MVQLVANLSDVPIADLEQRTGADRKKYYYLTYQVKSRFLSAAIEWSAWVGDICYGIVQAKYD